MRGTSHNQVGSGEEPRLGTGRSLSVQRGCHSWLIHSKWRKELREKKICMKGLLISKVFRHRACSLVSGCQPTGTASEDAIRGTLGLALKRLLCRCPLGRTLPLNAASLALNRTSSCL